MGSWILEHNGHCAWSCWVLFMLGLPQLGTKHIHIASYVSCKATTAPSSRSCFSYICCRIVLHFYQLWCRPAEAGKCGVLINLTCLCGLMPKISLTLVWVTLKNKICCNLLQVFTSQVYAIYDLLNAPLGIPSKKWKPQNLGESGKENCGNLCDWFWRNQEVFASCVWLVRIIYIGDCQIFRIVRKQYFDEKLSGFQELMGDSCWCSCHWILSWGCWFFPLQQQWILWCCRWGLSRHFHYVPEIMAAFFWTMPGLFNHVSASCLARSHQLCSVQCTCGCVILFLLEVYAHQMLNQAHVGTSCRLCHTSTLFSWSCCWLIGASEMIKGVTANMESTGKNIASWYHLKWSLGYFNPLLHYLDLCQGGACCNKWFQEI